MDALYDLVCAEGTEEGGKGLDRADLQDEWQSGLSHTHIVDYRHVVGNAGMVH